MKFKEKLKKVHYMHYLGIVLVLVIVLLSVFVFRNAFVRFFESLRDLFNSICYYFCQLFRIEHNFVPTINNLSSVELSPFLGLPATWDEFCIGWFEYWQAWASMSNFKAYLSYLVILSFNLLKIVLLVILPLMLVIYLMFVLFLSRHNNKYNKDSKPLKCIKWLSAKTYIPIKLWLCNFWEFLKVNKYIKIIFFILLFDFNIITIGIELIAYIFYFIISFNVLTLYNQIYKLCCDLSVAVAIIPWWCWLLFAYFCICKFRKKIGYSRLNHFERKNCGFINERPIVLMVCGTMGKKKTTTITDISLSQEAMFRDKAFELLCENDLKFPFFPWINLENALKFAMKKHIIYNLASCKKYIKHLEYLFYFETTDKSVKKSILRHLRKQFNLHYDNLLFDYDFVRYGLTYNDKLAITDIWSVLSTYSQLYFIYVIQSSLIISNYSVRADNLLDDIGNFPVWDTEFFQRPCEVMQETSRHAHIIDFDALRLGRKVLADNFKKDSFEFGVVNITEVGKERKNTLELKETKKKEESTNQKNDGFNDWLKMIRHSATVDNFPFVKVITDEQRPESWGADARDLCEIVHIKDAGKTKLAMPFFSLFELVHDLVLKRFVNLYYRFRYIRSDNILAMYFLKKLSALIERRYKRIYNTFGYCVLKVQVESGTQDGVANDKKYYLMSKKIYSKRFSTDCFSDYFVNKGLMSSVGINDLEEYKTEKATFEELKKQNSYFINDLIDRQDKDKFD